MGFSGWLLQNLVPEQRSTVSYHHSLCVQLPKRRMKQSQWSGDLLKAESGEPQGSLFLIQAQEEHATCSVSLDCISTVSCASRLSQFFLLLCLFVCRGPIFSSSVDGFHCLIAFFLVLPWSCKSGGFSSDHPCAVLLCLHEVSAPSSAHSLLL